MTKTQALQRLYKALTGEEGRNTGSKVIEDLAIAAENGEIGGGVKVAKMTVISQVQGENIYNTGFALNGGTIMYNGFVINTANVPDDYYKKQEMVIEIPVAENGTICYPDSNHSTKIEGNATLLTDPIGDGEQWWIITGDCEVTISEQSFSGGGNGEDI